MVHMVWCEHICEERAASAESAKNGHAQNCVLNALWTFCIFGYALWAMQCAMQYAINVGLLNK